MSCAPSPCRLKVIGAVRPEQAEDLRALGAALAVERSAFTEAVRDRYPSGDDAAINLVGGSLFDLVRD